MVKYRIFFVLISFTFTLLTSNFMLGQDTICNFESIKESYSNYTRINQIRFKNLITDDSCLGVFKNYKEELGLDEDEDVNIEDISVKIIPRYRYDLIPDGKGFTISVDIDTSRLPERLFIFYKKKLVGHVKFYYNDKQFLFYHKRNDLYDVYLCLSSCETLIFLCNIKIMYN